MKLFITLIFLAGSCTPYKLFSDKSESKGFDQFWADDIKPGKHSPKELKEILSDKLLKPIHAKPNQRVYGGETADANEYPFLVALILTEKDGKKIFCGGSLISTRYVLTAASCVDNAANATVIMGAHDRLDPAEPTRLTQVVKSSNFKINPYWDADTYTNDLALIKLNNIITPTPEIQTIFLADGTYGAIDGLPAGIPGWGYFNINYVLSQFVQYTQDVLISNAICRETYGKSVGPGNICLNGSSGKTACPGDTGGPLIIIDSVTNIPIQVGIASFGSEYGCEKFFPSVFTRVGVFNKWIKANANL